MSVWLWTFVVTKALPSMYTSLGYGVYIFFATMLILASIYAFFFIHETKGLRMDQMDGVFGLKRPEYAYDEGGKVVEDSYSEDKSRGATRVEAV